MGGRYPVLSPSAAIPVIQLKPSRTARILAPNLVFATVFILTLCTVAGVILSNTVYSSSSTHTAGVMTSQSFVLIASSFSIAYLVLHFIAAIRNMPVGSIRPPTSRLHSYCFIMARVTMVCWLASVIASSVVVSKPDVCRPGTRDCHLQTAGIVISGLAFLATGIILTALEACQYPFQPPKIARLPFMITCRVSSFGDDMVDSNISSSNASQANILQPGPTMSQSTTERSMPIMHDDYLFMGNEKEEWEKAQSLAVATANITKETNVKRKPLPKSAMPIPKSKSQTSIPGEFPEERPFTPVALVKSKSKILREAWTHLMGPAGTSDGKANSITDSAISLNSDTDSEATSPTRPTHDRTSSISQKTAKRRSVTPSSSISDVSMRSPLSTMRSAESPEVAIRPDLKLVPATASPILEKDSPRKTFVVQPLPIAKLNEFMKRPSYTRSTTVIRHPVPEDLPPMPPQHFVPTKKKLPARKKSIDAERPSASPSHITALKQNRKSSDEIKIPGAFIDYVPSRTPPIRIPSCEIKIPGAFIDDTEDTRKTLEAYAKKIGDASTGKIKLQRKSKSPPPPPNPKDIENDAEGEILKLYIPAPAGPREKTFKRRPFFPKSNAGVPRENRDTPQLLDAVKIEYTKVKPLRRLSLGDTSPGLRIWD